MSAAASPAPGIAEPSRAPQPQAQLFWARDPMGIPVDSADVAQGPRPCLKDPLDPLEVGAELACSPSTATLGSASPSPSSWKWAGDANAGPSNDAQGASSARLRSRSASKQRGLVDVQGDVARLARSKGVPMRGSFLTQSGPDTLQSTHPREEPRRESDCADGSSPHKHDGKIPHRSRQRGRHKLPIRDAVCGSVMLSAPGSDAQDGVVERLLRLYEPYESQTTPPTSSAPSPAAPSAPSPALPSASSPALPSASSPALPSAPSPALPSAPSPALPSASSPALPSASSPALPSAPSSAALLESARHGPWAPRAVHGSPTVLARPQGMLASPGKKGPAQKELLSLATAFQCKVQVNLKRGPTGNAPGDLAVDSTGHGDYSSGNGGSSTGNGDSSSGEMELVEAELPVEPHEATRETSLVPSPAAGAHTAPLLPRASLASESVGGVRPGAQSRSDLATEKFPQRSRSCGTATSADRAGGPGQWGPYRLPPLPHPPLRIVPPSPHSSKAFPGGGSPGGALMASPISDPASPASTGWAERGSGCAPSRGAHGASAWLPGSGATALLSSYQTGAGGSPTRTLPCPPLHKAVTSLQLPSRKAAALPRLQGPKGHGSPKQRPASPSRAGNLEPGVHSNVSVHPDWVPAPGTGLAAAGEQADSSKALSGASPAPRSPPPRKSPSCRSVILRTGITFNDWSGMASKQGAARGHARASCDASCDAQAGQTDSSVHGSAGHKAGVPGVGQGRSLSSESKPVLGPSAPAPQRTASSNSSSSVSGISLVSSRSSSSSSSSLISNQSAGSGSSSNGSGGGGRGNARIRSSGGLGKEWSSPVSGAMATIVGRRNSAEAAQQERGDPAPYVRSPSDGLMLVDLAEARRGLGLQLPLATPLHLSEGDGLFLGAPPASTLPAAQSIYWHGNSCPISSLQDDVLEKLGVTSEAHPVSTITKALSPLRSSSGAHQSPCSDQKQALPWAPAVSAHSLPRPLKPSVAGPAAGSSPPAGPESALPMLTPLTTLTSSTAQSAKQDGLSAGDDSPSYVEASSAERSRKEGCTAGFSSIPLAPSAAGELDTWATLQRRKSDGMPDSGLSFSLGGPIGPVKSAMKGPQKGVHGSMNVNQRRVTFNEVVEVQKVVPRKKSQGSIK